MFRLIAALALAGASRAALAAADPAVAVRLDQPLLLDGRLDELVWRQAAPLTDFYVHQDADGRRVRDTTVRLAYDDAWLYLGIACDHPLQNRLLGPVVTQDNGPVHQDESLELFLTADDGGRVYYHFLLSAFNVKAASRFVDGVRERETWNAPWRSATAVTTNGWTAEAAIPLYILLDHGGLDRLRLNLVRNRRVPVMDDSFVITHESMELSLWQPVTRTFHEPAAFARLAPLEPGKVRAPFLPVLDQVTVTPYRLRDGAPEYGLEIALRGLNRQPGTADIVVADRPVAGAASAVRRTVALNGPDRTNVVLAIPVATMAARTVTLTLRAAGDPAPFRTVTIPTPAALNVMTAFLDRNYYTAETAALAVAELSLPPDSLAGMQAAVTLNGQAAARAPAQPRTRVAFPIGALPAGTHPVTLTLIQADGTPFFSMSLDLVKRAPNPGCEWKVDQVNRVVLQPDGRPFFPIGLVMDGVMPEDDAAFQDIAAAGCNTFHQWTLDVTPDGVDAFLERAGAHGLYLVSQLESGWLAPKAAGIALPAEVSPADAARLMAVPRGGTLGMRGPLMTTLDHYATPVKTAIFREYVNKNLPVTQRLLERVRNRPALLAFSSFDEPFDSRRFDMTASLDATYRLASRADGCHPVLVLYSSHIPAGAEYVTCGDILMTDPYWTPAGPPGRNDPNFVSKIVRWTELRAAEFRKTVWIVNVAGIGWSGTRKRVLSGPEQQCQDILALIHGARGLSWFRYPMPEVSWQNLKASIAKIRMVGPMTVQPPVRQDIRHRRAAGPVGAFEDAPFIPDKEEFPDVQGRLFRDPADGALVLLAANSRYYPVALTVTVAGLAGPVTNLFTGRPIAAARDGSFNDALEPFGVRAYRLAGAPPEPVAATLAARRPAALPPPETALPNNARTGRKNVFPNPSFEDDSVAGLPDYYYGTWTLDASGAAKFGQKAVKLVKHEDPNPPYINITWSCAPQYEQPTRCVWSFWAKGARGGEVLAARHAPSHPVWANGGHWTLTTDWQRYDLPGIVIPARAQGNRADFAIMLSNQGTVWLDGVQLEAGDTPTEFEP